MKHSAKTQIECLQNWLREKGKWKPVVKESTTHVDSLKKK
jgi:hypothetical protein